MVICLERGADLHMAQLMPLPLTVSCFSKIHIGFTFLVPADPVVSDKGPLNGSVDLARDDTDDYYSTYQVQRCRPLCVCRSFSSCQHTNTTCLICSFYWLSALTLLADTASGNLFHSWTTQTEKKF